MRYIRPHIHAILEQYQGEMPLTHFLKKYFRQYPILGSRDRKIISEIIYAFYRTDKAIINRALSIEEKISIALLLTGSTLTQIKDFIPMAWQEHLQASLQEKTALLTPLTGIEIDGLFTWPVQLSEGISKTSWLYSMLEQPRLFIRIRSGYKAGILSALQKQGIDYITISEDCLSLPNGTQADKLLSPEQYVIQDASSQSTASFFHSLPKEKWYDCCSGAGGKSILLKDLQPSVQLTVSDTRESILHNLKERFRLYGHARPHSICADVSKSGLLKAILGNEKFDHIICDVPCSGSGTWARTPEQLYFFNPSFIREIARTQLQILSNVSHYTTSGGSVFYITCSVFRQENEDVTDRFLEENPGWAVHKSALINGLNMHADSMFITELVKQ